MSSELSQQSFETSAFTAICHDVAPMGFNLSAGQGAGKLIAVWLNRSYLLANLSKQFGLIACYVQKQAIHHLECLLNPQTCLQCIIDKKECVYTCEHSL